MASAATRDSANAPAEGRLVWARDPVAANVLTLNGYGVAVTVSRGHLVLLDGIGRQRRERRLPRVQQQVDRIVIIGHTGHISLEAFRWCAESGVALVQIDNFGKVTMIAATDGRDDPRLRRAQALAAGTPVGFNVAQSLISSKITGQRHVLLKHQIGSGELDGYAELADGATTLQELAAIEAQAAARYFNTWSNSVEVRFARAHLDRVPAHWTRFVARTSLIHSGPGARDAADPLNAILNYTYALAETECVIALRTVGLDPGLGVMHTDQNARDSLALDLIEPLRPVADDLVMQFLARRVFTADDFVEDGRGGCRLTPLLASELAGLLSELARVASHWAEQVSTTIAKGASTKIRSSAPLTRANWFAANGLEAPVLDAPHVRAVASCEVCGNLLAPHQKKHCKPCWEKRRKQLASEHAITRNAKLAELRVQGRDPRSTKQAKSRRSASISKSNQERAAWVSTPEEDSLDVAWYDREIQPHLAQFSVRTIQTTLGISNGGASQVRSGRFRPHKRHWLKLRELITTEN
jgi:CRISPR-associated endonuclease Cas1